MGAVNFIEFGAAETAEKAFKSLVEAAVYDHGHDPYNGTISTCSFAGVVGKVADVYSDEAEGKAVEMAEKNDYGEKREARAIDCGKTEDGSTVWAFYGWAAC